MVSKNTVKFIKSLHRKKIRKQEQLFFVEGAKNVTELLLANFAVHQLLHTDKFRQQHPMLVEQCKGETLLVTPEELQQMGTFQTNDTALAVARMPDPDEFVVERGELALALDDIRDPGNLGTIIRVADWYGIEKIISSPQTAEIFNPKVLHASMGSFCRIRWKYADLVQVLPQTAVPIYGACLEGQNVHGLVLKEEGIILMGNESRGISDELMPLVHHKISIPKFGTAESLNVAIATAVICDNFRRNKQFSNPMVPI
jgi:RNA methyltransferase, TrmH family